MKGGDDDDRARRLPAIRLIPREQRFEFAGMLGRRSSLPMALPSPVNQPLPFAPASLNIQCPTGVGFEFQASAEDGHVYAEQCAHFGWSPWVVPVWSPSCPCRSTKEANRGGKEEPENIAATPCTAAIRRLQSWCGATESATRTEAQQMGCARLLQQPESHLRYQLASSGGLSFCLGTVACPLQSLPFSPPSLTYSAPQV